MLVTSSDEDRRGWLEAIKAHFGRTTFKCSDVFPKGKVGRRVGVEAEISRASKDGAMRRETILKEQKNYTLKTADQRKGEMAYQVFDALDEDHFPLLSLDCTSKDGRGVEERRLFDEFRRPIFNPRNRLI